MIFITGAGPGDPKLLTVRAAELLARADIVVYDTLVSDAIVALARPGARRICVGKRIRVGEPVVDGKPGSDGGIHTATARHGTAPTQDEINALLVALSGESPSATIVRLKGGDPYLFGRGGEEAIYIASRGIYVAVVPGVSSALAAPASAGIPVTHRGLSSCVTILTGTLRDESRPDFSTIARLGGTLVFLMGAARAGEITRELVAAGMDPATPAAAIQWGTLPEQRSFTASLSEFADAAERHGLSPPAVLVVGRTVALSDTLNGFEVGAKNVSPLLFGRRLVVTLTPAAAAPLVSLLEDLGASVIASPALVLRDLDPAPLDAQLRNLTAYTDLILTSPRAVTIFAARLAALEYDARRLSHLSVAAIGRRTAAAVWENLRIRADVVPDEARAEGLTNALGDPRGRRFLQPRALEARDQLGDALGDTLTVVPVYEAVPGDVTAAAGLTARGAVAAIVLGSAAGARHFLTAALAVAPDGVPASVRVIALGPVTAAAVRAFGIEPRIAATPDPESIVAAIRSVVGR